MLATAIYVRVSSRSQDTASQEPDLKRWAAAQQDEPVRWYRDKFTGKTMDRPGFNRLLADVARRQGRPASSSGGSTAWAGPPRG